MFSLEAFQQRRQRQRIQERVYKSLMDEGKRVKTVHCDFLTKKS